MSPWEIYTWHFPGAGPHPAVIISSGPRVAHKSSLNILLCSSQRASRQVQPGEVLLDQADGLNWETICKCDLIHIAEKSELSQRRGLVVPIRRRAIVREIIQSCEWAGL